MNLIAHRTAAVHAAMRFCAIDDDTYEGAEDARCPMGFGPTPEAAIADLKRQLDEDAE